jgi:hypothetical protein
MEFAKQNHFHKPFSEVYFVEDNTIQRFPDLDKPGEISRQSIFDFDNYEKRFDEILNQGHCTVLQNL